MSSFVVVFIDSSTHKEFLLNKTKKKKKEKKEGWSCKRIETKPKLNPKSKTPQTLY